MSRRGCKGFWRNENGATAALYALALPALVAVGGVSFDYARLAGMDSELQNAADQAALAGATQLDGKSNARTRAATAACTLVANQTLLANDGDGLNVTSDDGAGGCTGIDQVLFWQDRNRTNAATSDADAHFVEVILEERTANYALTPVAGAFFGDIFAAAMAGLGSSICKVPPLMICSPDHTQPFNAAGKKGWGIQATAHGGSSWGAGTFGFLEVGTAKLQDLAVSLAFAEVPYDCAPIDGSYPETGNAQVLYDAINTRFDIYPSGGGVLAPCEGGACPAALNSVKDVVKADTGTGGNSCRLHGNGWHLPANRFTPGPRTGPGDETAIHDSDGVDAMGYTRDVCHYTSYGAACSSFTGIAGPNANRFGNGNWARGDYFAKYHPAVTPSANITRYETYLWEQGKLEGLGSLGIPHSVGPSGNVQYGQPICSGGSPGEFDRRLLTVAIVKNCPALTGGSTPVEVDEWVEMFLVEPIVDDSTERANGRLQDSVYLEVVRPATVGNDGGGAGAQTVRRDVPYLVR